MRLWLAAVLAVTCVSANSRVSEQSILPVEVNGGGIFVKVDDVDIYEEDLSIFFMIPDVPDTFKPVMHECKNLPKKVCDMVAPNAKLNQKSYDLIKLLNKMMTTKGLGASVLNNVTIPDDLFIKPREQKSATNYPADEWLQKVQQLMNRRDVRTAIKTGKIRTVRELGTLMQTAISTGLPFAKSLVEKLFFSESGLLSTMDNVEDRNTYALKSSTNDGNTVSELVTKSRQYMMEMAEARKKVEKMANKLESDARAHKMDIATLHDSLGFSNLHSADVSQLVFLTLTYFVHISALADCRDGNIPLAFVSPDVLSARLQTVQSELPSTKRLVMDIRNIQKYYAMKTATCGYDDRGGILEVKVPIVNSHSKYSLLKYIPLSFAWQNHTCTTDVASTFIIRDEARNLVYPVGQTGEDACHPKNRKCKVSKAIGNDADTLCITAIMEGGAAKAVNSVCKMKCFKSTRSSWTQISADTVVLTHPPEHRAQVVCDDGKIVKLEAVNEGAMMLKISCACALYVSNKFVWQPDTVGCDKRHDAVEMSVLVPIQWTKLTDYIPFDKQGAQGGSFVDAESLINSKWGFEYEAVVEKF